MDQIIQRIRTEGEGKPFRFSDFLMVALLVGLFAVCLMGAPSAYAQIGANQLGRNPNLRVFGTSVLATPYTNSTTTATTLLSVVNMTVHDPSELTYQNSGVFHTERLHVWWDADVTKSTSTTGSCGVALNGTLIAATVKFSASVGGRDSIGGFTDMSYPAQPFNVGVPKEVQTVSVVCQSQDTALFTVTNAQVYVEELW